MAVRQLLRFELKLRRPLGCRIDGSTRTTQQRKYHIEDRIAALESRRY